ncbi:hypothetical protein [Acidisoma sp.]|uniref:hypothetical protein n=1 Tax=Acidisoma sp. TaxID=1872115 RepID=UPI003B00E078
MSVTDTLPIDQGNGTNGVTLATLLAGQQPAIMTPTGSLLGRVSLGAGGPETISLGQGLVLTSGTISVGSISALLEGTTVDQLQPAAIAADSDLLAVDQGGPSLVRQTMAALWNYIDGKLPIATQRVVELTTNTVLDATAHNDAILVCSQPLTLSANFANMGSGFACDVLNLSAGAVTMGTGITGGSGTTSLPTQTGTRIVAVSYSGGNLVYWAGPQTAAAASSSSTTSGGSSVSSGGSTVTSGGSSVSSGGSSVTSGGSSVSSGGSSITSGGTSTSSGTATIAFVTAPSGSYTNGQGSIAVNATLFPGTAAAGIQFGFSNSPTVAPTSWTAGVLVNTESSGATFWGAYLTAPGTAGTYFCWAQALANSASAISAAIIVL